MNYKLIVKIASLALLALAFGQMAVAMEMPKEELNHALITATWSGKKDEVLKLLSNGADINYADKNGDTALICASCSNYPALVKILLDDKDIDVNYKNKWGKTPLVYASMCSPAIVQMLLTRKDIDVNCQSDDGSTALLEASKANKLEIVKMLLERKDIDINCADINGWTPLIYTSFRNYYKEVAQELLSHGAKINCTNITNKTALDYAKDQQNTTIIALIINEQNNRVILNEQNKKAALESRLFALINASYGQDNPALITTPISCRSHKISAADIQSKLLHDAVTDFLNSLTVQFPKEAL